MSIENRHHPYWLAPVVQRLGLLAIVLLAGGLLGAALVRVAPGFGVDERMLDTRLSAGSIQAVEESRKEGSDVLRYYFNYLYRLCRGDLGISVSLGRPVRELISERAGVTLRSASAGLLLAWMAALAIVLLLEWLPRRVFETAASVLAGTLLCVPAAVVALGCLYLGGLPALAISAVLFPRVYRYLRNIARAACGATHVLAAQAFGIRKMRVLTFHALAPVLPELLALAGVSVSMAVGAVIPAETLCDSAGLGQLVWQAALARDLPVLVNMTLLITAVTAGANLLADAARAAAQAEV